MKIKFIRSYLITVLDINFFSIIGGERESTVNLGNCDHRLESFLSGIPRTLPTSWKQFISILHKSAEKLSFVVYHLNFLKSY